MFAFDAFSLEFFHLTGGGAFVSLFILGMVIWSLGERNKIIGGKNDKNKNQPGSAL
jgi:hypothetical protein